ncbi:hypothetical protein MIND_00786600 [Mycena indigotica]|uniref:F-box domain-containing protein n=1 Tax=Mycena indigotica TaxID=2126181 RepID=A0A8H6SNT7_9AGAR|nr:uncharacterized protein MIND_00786600 [Mycena indigotica]KAF7302197.1 hypothetical protein MIND_00786600 [Mycena indigotica]
MPRSTPIRVSDSGNSRNIVDTLPPELLVAIFHNCLPVSTDAEHEPHLVDSNGAPLLLTQISSLWRRLALSTPTLWKTFYIDIDILKHPDRLSELAEMWLSRAGSCPLDISIKGNLYGDDQLEYGVEGFWEVFAEHTAHIRALHLLVNLEDVVTLDENEWTFPLLEELEITPELDIEDEDDDPDWPTITSFSSSKHLRKLTLDSLPLSSLSIPLASITHLVARGYKKLQHCLDALSNLPNLLQFDLEEYQSDSSVQPTEALPHSTLQRLHLTQDVSDLSPAPMLLQFLTLPALKELRVENTAASGSTVNELLARSSWPTLRALQLSPPGDKTLLSVDIFNKPSFATLEELEVSFAEATSLEGFFTALGADAGFLPRLKSFTLNCEAAEEDVGTADAAYALPLIATAVTKRLALQPLWTLRYLRVQWDANDPDAAPDEEVLDGVLGPFRLLKQRGVEVYIGDDESTSTSIV